MLSTASCQGALHLCSRVLLSSSVLHAVEEATFDVGGISLEITKTSTITYHLLMHLQYN